MRLEHLGKEITRQRRKQKLSLRQAGALAGLSYQAVRNAEHGEASFESALRIAKKLGVPTNILISLAESDAQDLVEQA